MSYLMLRFQFLQAEAVVTARLEVTPDEPRLWCALGDLRLDDACYERAWLRSGKRSARAKRSLARRCYSSIPSLMCRLQVTMYPLSTVLLAHSR